MSRGAATQAVDLVVDAIIREVSAGGTVGITGFGTFERVDRAPRTGRNPRTGDVVPIEGTSAPRFRPGTYFKQVVAEPGLLPEDGLAGGRAGPGDSGPAPARTAHPRGIEPAEITGRLIATKKAQRARRSGG